MRPSDALNANRSAIRDIIATHRGLNPRVFGSVVRGTDTEDSDLDLLIDPAPGMSLFDLGAIDTKLRELLNVDVDVTVAPPTPVAPVLKRIVREALPV